MTMQAEVFPGELRPEKPSNPEKSLKEQIRALLKAADAQVTKILSRLGLIEKDLGPNPTEHLVQREKLKQLQQESQAAYDELRLATDSAIEVEKPIDLTFLQAPSCDFDALESLIQKQDPHLSKKLEASFGKNLADKLQTSPEYRATLKQLDAQLKQKHGGNGPEICTDRNLKNLIAIHETIGGNVQNVLKAMDLKSHTEGIEYRDTEQGGLLTVEDMNIDPETGLPQTRIDIQIPFTDGTEHQSIIQRKFELTHDVNENGKPISKRRVIHSRLDLPNQLKSKNLAAKITEQSLRAYDEAGIDDIGLHAVEVGGYAWASYGYGWDTEKMVELTYRNQQNKQALRNFDEKQFRESLKHSHPEASISELNQAVSNERQSLLSKAAEKTTQNLRKLSPAERNQLLEQNLASHVEDAKQSIESVLSQVQMLDEEGEATNSICKEIIQKLRDAETSPLAVTPQFLASLGKDGPFFRRGASDTWYTEEQFQQALADGTETGEAENYQGPLHLGKIALLFHEWYGKIELKPDGKQKGKNRQLLKQKIERSV